MFSPTTLICSVFSQSFRIHCKAFIFIPTFRNNIFSNKIFSSFSFTNLVFLHWPNIFLLQIFSFFAFSAPMLIENFPSPNIFLLFLLHSSSSPLTKYFHTPNISPFPFQFFSSTTTRKQNIFLLQILFSFSFKLILLHSLLVQRPTFYVLWIRGKDQLTDMSRPFGLISKYIESKKKSLPILGSLPSSGEAEEQTRWPKPSRKFLAALTLILKHRGMARVGCGSMWTKQKIWHNWNGRAECGWSTNQ